MSFLDIIIVLPLIWAGWKGFKKGLIIEVCTLLALAIGVWGGVNFSDFVADGISNGLGWESKYLPVISFTITFLIIGASIYFLGVALERVVNIAQLKMINKVFGAVFGVTKLLLFMSVFLVILEAYDEKGDFISEDLKNESLLYHPTKDFSLTLIPALKYSKIFVQGGKTYFEMKQNLPDVTQPEGIPADSTSAP